MPIGHCSFKKLNSTGKCIAICHHNTRSLNREDCTGNTGKTMDLEQGREVALSRVLKLDNVKWSD